MKRPTETIWFPYKTRLSDLLAGGTHRVKMSSTSLPKNVTRDEIAKARPVGMSLYHLTSSVLSLQDGTGCGGRQEYLSRGTACGETLRTSLLTVLSSAHAVSISVGSSPQAKLEAALQSKFPDFEDAVIHEAALHVGVDGIVTRDILRFKRATISVYSPDELIQILRGRGKATE